MVTKEAKVNGNEQKNEISQKFSVLPDNLLTLGKVKIIPCIHNEELYRFILAI
jgi:hypothetical protein